MHIGLVKTFTAGADIPANSLVKFSADDTVVHAAAATDLIVGVCIQPSGAKNGERVDVQLDRIADVVVGTGGLTRGGLVTSDANGAAVAAAPTTGNDNRVAGIAMKTANAGDIVGVLLSPGSVQG